MSSSKGKARSAASSSSNAAAGMAPKRRNGPRGCRSISNQECGSSASIPQDAPILQDEIPQDAPILQDEIPELWDEIHEPIQDEISEFVLNDEGSTTHRAKINASWNVEIIDGQGNRKQTRLKLKDLISNKVGYKVLTQWNARCRGIGDSAGLLNGYLGRIASNFEKFPILYENWKEVPGGYKDNVYNQTIKEKFVVDDFHNKKVILQSLGKKWRDNRYNLFRQYYNWELTLVQNLQRVPPGINPDHWNMFVRYRLSVKTMAIADQNAENRSKQTVLHTLGTKSLARKQYELELQNGRTYTRGDMYQVSHMKKDGEFVNDEAREIYEQLQEEIQNHSNENEAFVAVFGKEHPGYVRSMGLGVVPSQINGRNPSFMANSESDPKIVQMQIQIDTLKELAESNRLREQLAEQTVESKKLKAKMAEFDVVKQQLAYLMRNARGNHPGSSSNGAI